MSCGEKIPIFWKIRVGLSSLVLLVTSSGAAAVPALDPSASKPSGHGHNEVSFPFRRRVLLDHRSQICRVPAPFGGPKSREAVGAASRVGITHRAR